MTTATASPLRAARHGVVAACLVLWLLGCQSARSWEQGCPGVYSGVRYYNDQRPELPWDGKVFFTIDLLPTVAVDTLALPVTAFAKPEKPKSGFPVGCKWASR